MSKYLTLSLFILSLAACVPPGEFSTDRKLTTVGGQDDGAIGSTEDSGTVADSGSAAEDSGSAVADSGSADAGTWTPPTDTGDLPGPDPSLSCDSQVYSGGSSAVCDTLFVGHHSSDPTRAQLLDRCGNPFIFRGVEEGVRAELKGDNWEWLRELSGLHMNAIRILPHRDDNLSAEDLDTILDVLREEHMIVWISPSDGDESARGWFVEWFEDRIEVLLEHQDHIIIDAMPELDTWECEALWISSAKAAIENFRSVVHDGQYLRMPLSVMGSGYGRDVACTFQYGAEVVARDPLRNVAIGWQAYWTDWYQSAARYGDPDTLIQRVLDNDAFPINVGLTTNPSGEGYAYYREFMEDAEGVGTTGRVGYLWWHWLDTAFEGLKNRDTGGYTTFGQEVLVTAPYAFTKQNNTKACFPDG